MLATEHTGAVVAEHAGVVAGRLAQAAGGVHRATTRAAISDAGESIAAGLAHGAATLSVLTAGTSWCCVRATAVPRGSGRVHTGGVATDATVARGGHIVAAGRGRQHGEEQRENENGASSAHAAIVHEPAVSSREAPAPHAHLTGQMLGWAMPYLRLIALILSIASMIACGDDTRPTGDAGGTDAAVSDAGGTDAGTADAGGVDAGAVDAGPGDDAGGSDAGGSDAGGSDAGSSDAGSSDGGRTGLPTGTTGCTSDAECASNVCWDFSDYDPYCGGTICSEMCATTADCVAAATAARASSPDRATCGSDNRCDFVGTGLGPFYCT